MNVYCVGRNYVEHARELDNEVPTKPLIFCKTPSSIVQDASVEFEYPHFSNDVHFEGELVLRMGLDERGALLPTAITFGIDFTARDIQSELKSKGHPWELAKSFKGAGAMGPFIAFDAQALYRLETRLNGATRQDGDTTLMIFDIPTIVKYLALHFPLLEGDLIFMGTPAGVGSVSRGDTIEGYLNGNKLLTCKIK